MTDDELLAYYRDKHGNPYLPLSLAKRARTFEFRYMHLGVEAARREQAAREEQQRRLRDLVNRNAARRGDS